MYRHLVEPRVKLYSPREETFSIPLKYIDVSRTTHTNLDVMQERRIDDYWNNKWSNQAYYNGNIRLKERPAGSSYGTQKRNISEVMSDQSLSS